MLHSDSVRYLEKAGFHYKPAESPDLWNFLEGHFAGPHAIGPKFVPMPANFIAELILLGEEALLEALVAHHRQNGTPGRVARVLDLPYVVGTSGTIPLAKADSNKILNLIEQPGTPNERLIHVLPSEADDIPCTSRVTVTGGVYADGRTAGYFDLRPGEWADETATTDEKFAYLATSDEIAAIVKDMEAHLEDIAVAPRRDCESMIRKAKKLF